MHHILRQSKRLATAIAGGVVVLIGVVLIPYPGPGWLVVFAGLAILSTEFEFASRALTVLKGKYEQWRVWLKKQPLFLRILVICFTVVVVTVTAWLLNTFGLINSFLHLHQTWLVSPFLRD